MINNYGDTGSGFGGHSQPSAPLPRSMEHSKQQNVAPSWGYNTQLEGLYSCYPSEPQPMYNIHSMGHFENSGKHNNNHYPQYPAGAMHQPVPTPVVKCHEACCQNLSDHSRYPVNPAPLRYPPTVSVQPPRYGDITNSEHRQYFQDRRGLQPSVTRKKEFQTDGGFSGVHHDRHFSQCVGRGQIHVPENRQSMQVVRSQYPMYPINSYWSPRSWTGPRVNYPPPPPYHQSVSSQSAQLQSGMKMPDPPHYIESNMQKQLGNQQRRTAIRNGNGTTEVVRPIPENKRPAIDGNHIQSCYDFPYTSGFVPFNDVSKITSNSVSHITNTSCKISNDKQFQHQMQYAVQNNDRTVSGCNDPMGDISYSMNFSIPNGESYMRQPVEGSEQIPATRKLAVQYEQPPVGKKRPDLDVRQFLATWEDDEEDSARMSEPLTNNNNGAPYIVLDYRSLDNESSAKTQERLKPSGVQVCSSKPQNSSPGLDNKRQTSEDVNSREKENQRSVIHSEYLSQNSFLQPTVPTMHNDMEKNLNFWGPNTRENCPVSEALMSKSVFQPLDCSKRDTLNVVEPIIPPPKRDSHMHGDMSNHKMMSSDSNHISFDALVTYYGDSRRGSDGSYDLVEMTERLVNATDKICTSERNPLEQQLPPDIMGCNEMRVHHQPQIGVNPNSFHNRLPPHYAGNTFQHFKQSVSTDGFFNLKQPVAHNKYFSIDQPQMMDQGSFEFHKSGTEFENQRTYDLKDNTNTTKIQEGMILKDGRKVCQQDNKKGMYNESLRNSEIESSSLSHDKENVEFVGVDPEQFITPIIIKKSDYRNKDCDKSEDTTKEKNSQTETEVISEKTLFNTGSERTILISNDIGTEVFKVPYSPDKKQFSRKDNIVTLHSGDNTKCNTVTVEVPYVQQYSNLVKLSEEMTQADNISDNKNCTSNEVQYNTANNICGPTDVKNKTDESKRTTSLKLKRLPNSKEWIKIDEEMKSSEKNDCVSQKNEKHNMKDSTSDSIENCPARVINLNMPSLDDSENSNHTENAPETQRVAPTECRGKSNYSSRSRHNDNINPDNMSVPQLAIVSPLKFVSGNKDESSTSMQSNGKQKKDNYFQADKQFFSNNTNSQSYEDDPPNSSCLQHEIENQFQQVHSPYNTLYLNQKQNLIQSGHSSSSKHFSDIQYLSENGDEKHENFKPQKKIQRVESFQQTTSTDISENNQQVKNKDNNKEQFSAFYSGQDITSHMSPFNLSSRLLTNEKDLDHHIPTSPGVDEMFEDINNPGHDSLFENKTDNLPELTENSSFTLTSSCQTGNSFDNFFEQGSSVEGGRPCESVKRASEEITLNQSKTSDDGIRSNCCIIMKKNSNKSSSCENLQRENGELSLAVKVNSPKSTWNLSQNRETCQDKNACSGIIPVTGSTDFASSEQVSSGAKDFINDSFHSFDYVHTSVLQQLNDTARDSSLEVVIDTSSHEGKCANFEKHTESKSEYNLMNSNSDVNSALIVSDKQEHINCNSDEVSENSDLKEKNIIASDETSSEINCTTKLESLGNILPVESDRNIESNQHGEHLKSSHICERSPVGNCENINQDKEVIQSVVSNLVRTAVDCEDINVCGTFNTIECKYEGTENDTGDANHLKQVCAEISESDKSNNKCEMLCVSVCNKNESNILPEKSQNKLAEENVKCTVDSDDCLNNVAENQTNLTDSVHNGCNGGPQITGEGDNNCTSVINNTYNLNSATQTIKNGERSDQEILELTVNKFEEPYKGRIDETNCVENIVNIDSRLVIHENSNSANENLTEENDESKYKKNSKVKPFTDMCHEQTTNEYENIPYHINQEAVVSKTEIRKSQTSEEDTLEITVKECGIENGCKNIPLLNEAKPDVRISVCVNSESENDNIDSILHDKDIKIIHTSKLEFNSLSQKTERMSENEENGLNGDVEDCHVHEMCKDPEEGRKFENEILVIKKKTEYKNSIKCSSHVGSKIAVVSPLQSSENKHSDNVVLDTDNTSIAHENCNDSFQSDCNTVLKVVTTNKPKFAQEGGKQNNEKIKSSLSELICVAEECKDYLESASDTEHVHIVSDYSSKSEIHTNGSMSGPSQTSIIDKLNQLEMQDELSKNEMSSLEYKIHAEYKSERDHENIKASNFSSEENGEPSIVHNERKEIILQDLMKEKTTDQTNTECNSKCNIGFQFSGELKKGDELNIEKFIDIDKEDHSVCSDAKHQNFMINKVQIENNFDSLNNLQDKIYSNNICESNIEHSQNIRDVEIKSKSEFISTDFTTSESMGICSEYDTEINATELHIGNINVPTDRDVTENEESGSECIDVEEAKTEGSVIHTETDVIMYASNSLKENIEGNEISNAHSNIHDSQHTNKISFPNETLYSHLSNTSDLNMEGLRDVNITGEGSSTVDKSQCVAEELSMDESETKEQHKASEVPAKETIDCVLPKSENSSLNPLITLDKSLMQINEPDSKKECNREYACTLNENVLESKIETNLDCQLSISDDYNKSKPKISESIQNIKHSANGAQCELQLSTNSGEQQESSNSLKNVTVCPSNCNTISTNLCNHTSVNSETRNFTNNENITCDTIQYDSICNKPESDNSYRKVLPYFESAYDSKNVFTFKQSEHNDLKTVGNNFKSCMQLSNSEIKTHSKLEIQIEHTPSVTGVECDDEVMDLSCNVARHSCDETQNWGEKQNFETVHHEESNEIDCDDLKTKHVGLDDTRCSVRDSHENISETADSKYQKYRADEVFNSVVNLSPSLETKHGAVVNTDKSVHNSSDDNIDMDCSESVSTKAKCEEEYVSTCENESADSQFVDNIKETQEIDRPKIKTTASSNFGMNGELKIQQNKVIHKYLPTDSVHGHDNTDWKYVSCGSQTCTSDGALVEDSFNEGNENGNKVFHKPQSSINKENLSHIEEPSDFTNKNNNVVSLENSNEIRTANPHISDTSLSVESCNSIQENDVNVEGNVNEDSTDNYEFGATKIDSESKHYERALHFKSAQTDHSVNKTYKADDSNSIQDENSFNSGSKYDVEIHQKILIPPNVENHLDSPSHNAQNENVNTFEENCVVSPQILSDMQEGCIPVKIQEGDMNSDVKSKVRTFGIGRSQLENTDVLSNSNEEIIDEARTELNINKCEVDTDRRKNTSVVISNQNCDDLDNSTDVCSANLEPENEYINENECLVINEVSQHSNEKSCVDDNLLENIDRVRNSLTLSGNNNFEKLLDPYEFQSSLYNDVSIKSEILSNITNIPSKESCPLQCLVEAALALETAVVNKISQENTDGIQNSEHIIKRKNFYCNNLLNEDSKNIVTSNSTTRTVQKSLDTSFGSNYEVTCINSHLHQTRNEEVRCSNELSSDDMNVSSNDNYIPKYQRRKGIKQKEKRKTKKKYKKRHISQLKHTQSKTKVKSNKDNLTKHQCAEFTYENSKDSGVDIRSSCDLGNGCHETSVGDVRDECEEECLTPSVPFEDNKINCESVSVTDISGDTGHSQRDFIVPDQSVVCFQVTSDKMDEYMNQISNLTDVEVITENADNNSVSVTKSVGNKSCVDSYPKIPGVDLENETSLVIIIEEIGGTSESIPDRKETVTLEKSVECIDNNNFEMSIEEKEGSSSTDYFLPAAKKENSSSCLSLHNGSIDSDDLSVIHKGIQDEENLKNQNVKSIIDNSEEQKLDLCCETSESYEHINENLVNGISNWPFLEEEIALEQNYSSQNLESKKQPYHLKCSLPWERIFNISNSRKRKTSRSKQDTNVGLELGPAKVEVRLGTESGVWKVVNNSPNDCSSPVVKVKRLILQRDPDLTSSYSEKESEEENDTREKTKNSLSQSSDDSVPKVVIKKKSTSEYTSFLRLSDDEKWQPVVMLTRNKELDELILREKYVVSSPCYINTLDARDTNSHERQALDVFNYISENESPEETKLNSPTETKVLPEISNFIFKNAVKKRTLKRRFKFSKLKERKFNKSNYFYSNALDVEKRVFFDDESSGSNKESDYSPTCPVDASQEYAWQCIEKNGGESPESDSKVFVTDCIISQEDTAIENEDITNTVDVAPSNRTFSNPTGRNSPEILSEDIASLIHCATTENANSASGSDNTISKNNFVSIKSFDTDVNHVVEASANDINEDIKIFNLTVSDEISKDREPEEARVDVIETLSKSISDNDSLNQDQNEVENVASKNEIDQRQSCGTNTESDIKLFGSLNDICIQSTQCSNPVLSKSVRDIILEKPPSENRDRGMKRPSEGHSREDTKRRRYNIKRYPLECHKCHIGFEDKEELMHHKKSRHTPRELHHCLLCQRSFSSSLRYSLHVQGRSHRHIDLVQRYTMHTMHRLITGTDYPLVHSLTKSELQAMDWRPNYPGCNHYYHQPTPLQIALQEHSKGDKKIAVNHI